MEKGKDDNYEASVKSNNEMVHKQNGDLPTVIIISLDHLSVSTLYYNPTDISYVKQDNMNNSEINTENDINSQSFYGVVGSLFE